VVTSLEEVAPVLRRGMGAPLSLEFIVDLTWLYAQAELREHGKPGYPRPEPERGRLEEQARQALRAVGVGFLAEGLQL
jgi:hypothetical protein